MTFPQNHARTTYIWYYYGPLCVVSECLLQVDITYFIPMSSTCNDALAATATS